MRLSMAAAFCSTMALAQGSEREEYGVAVPVTLSGGAFYTHRLQVRERARHPEAAAFRAMLYPTVKLGSHWFGYAALQVHSTPYFYYDAFNPARDLEIELVQGYVGYAARKGRTTMAIKAGQLVSAFGSFPLRYNDAENPLMDQPLSYIQSLTLRHDQLSCGTADLHKQTYGSVIADRGGAVGRARGMTPVTLYGMRSTQIEISADRVDARFQVTSGSPINPQGWSFGRYCSGQPALASRSGCNGRRASSTDCSRERLGIGYRAATARSVQGPVRPAKTHEDAHRSAPWNQGFAGRLRRSGHNDCTCDSHGLNHARNSAACRWRVADSGC